MTGAAALTAWVAVLGADAHAGPAATGSVAAESVTESVLPNGLRVVFAPDPSVPVVSVDVWYHVGSRDEEPQRTGFAHLFEHLMFQGSPSQPGEYFGPLERVGGDINGSTNQDRTNYYELVPREALPLALFLEADRMRGLLDVLDQAKLDNQREVVRNERRQRIENVPYADARLLLGEALFPADHPYHHPVIGSHADLEAATVDDVSAFFRRWYTPRNAVLTVVGDFDPVATQALVDQWFGPIPGGEDPRAVVPSAPKLAWDVEERLYRDVPLRKVWLAWVAPPIGDHDEDPLDLLASVLGEGRDGRLVRELVEERRIAADIAVYLAGAQGASQFVVTATAAPGHTTDEVVDAVDEVLGQVLGDGEGARAPSQAELDALVAMYELDAITAAETTLGRAELLQWCARFRGGPACLDAELARYHAAAVPDEVVAAGRAWLLGSRRVALHILPSADRPDQRPPTPVAEDAPTQADPAQGVTAGGGR